jgi:hypothetical protein
LQILGVIAEPPKSSAPSSSSPLQQASPPKCLLESIRTLDHGHCFGPTLRQPHTP